MKRKWIISVLCLFLVTLSGCSMARDRDQDNHITVYLWNKNLLSEYAPYVQAQVPEADIQFVVGNNDLDYYRFLLENNSLPDVITNRRFSLRDAQALQGSLLDLSRTEAAGSYYPVYLENYRGGDGTLNWLPVCGEIDGIVANKALFEAYGVPLPTDYESFVDACRVFESQGIRGFATDYGMDYTCMEVLQGVSIPSLNSLEGRMWRMDYENGKTDFLDQIVWPAVIQQMERFLSDTGARPEDLSISSLEFAEQFRNGKIAMVRETARYVFCDFDAGESEPVMLPYFNQMEEEAWLLTYPAFQIALNKELAADPARQKLALKVLDAMVSGPGQTLISNGYMLPYNRTAQPPLAEELINLQPEFQNNHLYIRLASNDFFCVSKEVVQAMIEGEYDSSAAYDAFNEHLSDEPAVQKEPVASLTESYAYRFDSQMGNEAVSSFANTMRLSYDTELLLAPSCALAGPLLAADYTQTMLEYTIAPQCRSAYSCELTGTQLFKLIKNAVEGGISLPVFNRGALPVSSGFTMEVEETEQGFHLLGITIAGKSLKKDSCYQLTLIGDEKYASELLSHVFPEQEPDGFLHSNEGKDVRRLWTDYICQGAQPAKPAEYIILR